MRWLIALILLALLAWHFHGEREPVPVEETFIAEPLKAQRKAEHLETQVLEGTRAQQDRMERQLDGDGG